MKKMKFIVTVMLVMITTASLAQSGNNLSLKVNYSVATPTGSFKDLIDKTSFTGFGAEVMYRFNEQFSAGLATGSQEFYRKYPRQVYKASDGSDISAVLSYAVQTVPILAKFQYHILPGKAIQPWVAVGVGGNLIDYQQFAGQFGSDSKTKFGFAARPEAGVFIPDSKSKNVGIDIGVGYSIMPFKYASLENLNNLNAKIGIAFPLR